MSAPPDDLPNELATGLADPAPAPILPPRRIPNLGHAVLFVSFTGLTLLLLELAATLLGKAPASTHAGAIDVLHPKLQVAIEASSYAITLLAAGLFFPIVWRRGFLDGLNWNWPAARAQAGKLAGLGLLLGAMMQVVTYYITPPKTLPIDDFFATPSDAWLVTVFGVVVAPIFEEIAFRGFLLPAFAIAYDWLSLPRTEEARLRWRTTTTLTVGAYAFSAVFTSVLFALIHAQQVSHLWAALLVLFSVSFLLSYVRVRTQSVAASAIVHSAYNAFVFLTVLLATGGYRHLDRMTK
ncbi:MAG: CPBP family intramembrane glutamic endopeptidase [Acidobacteriaceae bacterium]|jgi:membrane protease YdiL (CAAX protease family)